MIFPIESTKALQDQVLSVDGPKSDLIDTVEMKRLKDEMTSMKKKLMGKWTFVPSLLHCHPVENSSPVFVVKTQFKYF